MNKKQSKLSLILPLWHETSSKVSHINKLGGIFENPNKLHKFGNYNILRINGLKIKSIRTSLLFQ